MKSNLSNLTSGILITISALITLSSAHAQIDWATVGQMNVYAKQAQQAWWNSLTPREQYLEQQISNLEFQNYQTYGSGIYPTADNLSAVMQIINAASYEADFVANRLQYHYQFYQTLNQGYQTINRADTLIQNIMSGACPPNC